MSDPLSGTTNLRPQRWKFQIWPILDLLLIHTQTPSRGYNDFRPHIMDQQGTSSHNMFFFCVALSCGLVLELCSPKAMFWFYLILASCQGLACCQLSLSFPDLLQAFHGTQHQQGDGSNSAGSLRSSLIERKETNPEKKMYEIIDGYSLLFMAKAPRHDARVIPFKRDKM